MIKLKCIALKLRWLIQAIFNEDSYKAQTKTIVFPVPTH